MKAVLATILCLILASCGGELPDTQSVKQKVSSNLDIDDSGGQGPELGTHGGYYPGGFKPFDDDQVELFCETDDLWRTSVEEPNPREFPTEWNQETHECFSEDKSDFTITSSGSATCNEDSYSGTYKAIVRLISRQESGGHVQVLCVRELTNTGTLPPWVPLSRGNLIGMNDSTPKELVTIKERGWSLISE